LLRKIELPYDPVLLLLGIYLPKKKEYKRETCKSQFIPALLTIANLWNQPRYPSTVEWIKKMYNAYTMEYYSAIKKNELISFARKWM
jgi:electron transfer flavoprotein alpha/beta subunit